MRRWSRPSAGQQSALIQKGLPLDTWCGCTRDRPFGVLLHEVGPLRHAAYLGFHTFEQEQRYADVLGPLTSVCDRKYDASASHAVGLAGLGEFHLDCLQFGHEPVRATASARRALAGILLFKLARPHGVAFPGYPCCKISCDFATGSAGIALFIHRMLRSSGAPFMADELV